MTFYKRCPACDGKGQHEAETCEPCDGYGGWWVVTEGPGMNVVTTPGDADDRPDGCGNSGESLD